MQGKYSFDIRDFGAVADDYTKATENVAAIQAAFDAAAAVSSSQRAEVRFPGDGKYYLNAPVFAPALNTTISGDGMSTLHVAPYHANPLLVVGAPHFGRVKSDSWVDLYGLLDTSVAPAPGMAYGLDTSKLNLRFKGTPFDLGPPAHAAAPSFWSDLSQLTISFAIRPNAGWDRMGVILAMDPQSFPPRAYPIALYSNAQGIGFKFQDTNGRTHTFVVPVTMVDNQVLRVVLMLDLNDGRATAYVNGSAVAVKVYADQGWGPGGNLRIAAPGFFDASIGGSGANFVLCGLKLADGLRFPMDVPPGTALGSSTDAIYSKFIYGVKEFAALEPATSPTADCQKWRCNHKADLSGYGIAVLPDGRMPTPWPSGVSVSGLNFVNQYGYGQGLLYHTMLSLRVDSCRFQGGANGIANIVGATSYPVILEDITTNLTKEAAIHLGFGIYRLNQINLGRLGRYGISTYSGCQVSNFFSSEGQVEACVRLWGWTADSGSLILEHGGFNFEAVAAKHFVQVAPTNGVRTVVRLNDVAFGMIEPGSTAIKVDSLPVADIGDAGQIQPIVQVELSGGTGLFLSHNAAALVGVDSGASVRVVYESDYPISIPLVKNVQDPTQGVVWGGFTPGRVPTMPDGSTPLGGLVTSLPPIPQPTNGFRLDDLPGLKGRYRAIDQGADGTLLSSLQDYTGETGRTALNLTGSSASAGRVVTSMGRSAIRLSADQSYFRDLTLQSDSTAGATVIFAFQFVNGTHGIFRSGSNGRSGLVIDGLTSLNGATYLDATTKNPGERKLLPGPMVVAVSLDRTSGDWSYWINGRKTNSRRVLDPALLKYYSINGFTVGGSVYNLPADLYELLVVFGPLSDQAIKDSMYQLMNDYRIYG